MRDRMQFFVLAFFATLVLIAALVYFSGYLEEGVDKTSASGGLSVNSIPIISTLYDIPETDNVIIRSIYQYNDRVVMNVSFEGCTEHNFELFVAEDMQDEQDDSSNPGVYAILIHDQVGDTCMQTTQKTIDFSLSELREQFGESFRMSVQDSHGNSHTVDVRF